METAATEGPVYGLQLVLAKGTCSLHLNKNSWCGEEFLGELLVTAVTQLDMPRHVCPSIRLDHANRWHPHLVLHMLWQLVMLICTAYKPAAPSTACRRVTFHC